MVLFLGIEKSLLPFTVFPLFFVMGLEDKIFIKLRIIFLCIVFFENQKM
ncbi:MAG: seg [Candidatus Campbellbacteria bacterium GW2011_OD1_34_28]|nr:MAG: seg [Candidatus Campbellbacteria bacterium GW2011_OD1_34_28]